MELHAEGLRRLGEQATTFFTEDITGVFAEHVPGRLPGTKTFLALAERVRREQPDVINVHTPCAPAWILARRSGLIRSRIVVMSYAADEGAIRVTRPRDLLRWVRAAVPARATFPRADGIWCVNQSDAEFYRSRYGVAPDVVRCIPHAVGDTFYQPARETREPRQLLFAGTWIVRKGVDVLAPALDRAVGELPDLEIVIAGTIVPAETVAAALTPRVRERTEIRPTLTDTEFRQVYAQSSLLVVPSRLEGLPIVMLEAMACGCPTLGAANSGMLDVIEPERNGWLEDSFDPERWARRIVDIMRAPEALARASAGASATAEGFRIETVTRTALEWYRRLDGRATPS
jgi:glycosyltransferase involved in cell wall biosynthesis